VFYIYRFRYKRKEHQLIEQNLEIEKKLLLMQMNPHFIFNSLNSIHGFITNKEPDKAKEYLARFGNLMRLVLENSRKSLVVLEDEVEMLDLYLSLEKTRFNGKFRYNINISGLNKEEVFIPPMLIQPFAENAVKHGMKNREDGNGIISISFTLRNSHILCVVEDNGPGIDETVKNQNQFNGSLGMKLTSERIEILSRQWIKNLDLKVVNIGEKDKEKTGTRVEIEMPFEIES
jgi:LytS/YehU family sensor histidine kinase